MKRFLAVAMIAALALGGCQTAMGADRTAAAENAKAPAAKAEKPRIEVVFVLDTTGSMSGLIEAAKQKIWSIANTLAMAKPTPEIKMGLVAYRDRGDAYVTSLTDLTDDFDAVYADLMAFKAEGGGDTPESVNQALRGRHAVPWSADPKTYKCIFLVGDAPPHMDYPTTSSTPRLQASRGGRDRHQHDPVRRHAETTPPWTEIAHEVRGQVLQGRAVRRGHPGHDAV